MPERPNPSLSANSQAIQYKDYLVRVSLPRVGHSEIGVFVDVFERNQAAAIHRIAPSHTGRGR